MIEMIQVIFTVAPCCLYDARLDQQRVSLGKASSVTTGGGGCCNIE
jgi:hypothetical protein